MKIRILKNAKFRPWFTICRRWGHQWEATSAETRTERIYRCGACSKEKWGEKFTSFTDFPVWF